ncbi:hypothetical protein BDZ85DRAFT_260306 [Elsinoe ampelina]|uniref:Uncharacterized protein n=1 Tax=Elsinoe ampelina TaxID=302913 RepID=A0A6A6GE99_9PEZI|nr:hypothetical protein BDZ85DRAFT_260306 [Elsinoe ampelina]
MGSVCIPPREGRRGIGMCLMRRTGRMRVVLMRCFRRGMARIVMPRGKDTGMRRIDDRTGRFGYAFWIGGSGRCFELVCHFCTCVSGGQGRGCLWQTNGQIMLFYTILLMRSTRVVWAALDATGDPRALTRQFPKQAVHLLVLVASRATPTARRIRR